jgi:hypothetical protein
VFVQKAAGKFGLKGLNCSAGQIITYELTKLPTLITVISVKVLGFLARPESPGWFQLPIYEITNLPTAL